MLGPGRLQPPQFRVLDVNRFVRRLLEEQLTRVQSLARMLNRRVRLTTHPIVCVTLLTGLPPLPLGQVWQCTMNIVQFPRRSRQVAETYLPNLVAWPKTPLESISVHPVLGASVGQQQNLIPPWESLLVTLRLEQSPQATRMFVPQPWTSRPRLLV